MPRGLVNPHFRAEFAALPPSPAALGLHRRLPGYAPTPLRSLPRIAARFSVGAIDIKDESARLGLPAYKILGAAWATYVALRQRFGGELEPWSSIEGLGQRLAAFPPVTLVTATDGNHGRGVARVARWLGLAAEIYLPRGTAAARLRGIRSEGARVIEVDGTYDDTVSHAAAVTDDAKILIQDHGWPGYEEVPARVAEGYQTIFLEIETELGRRREPPYDLVLLQIGVGTLASAAIRHYRRAGLAQRPALVGVEPTGAACALLSIEAGQPVMISAGADASIMAGLNCGTPSSAAWPYLRDGVEAFLAVDDDQAREAMRLLAAEGIVSGESGAAGLAGLLELREGRECEEVRERLRLSTGTRVLLLSTEGATDPENWERVVGRPPPA